MQSASKPNRTASSQYSRIYSERRAAPTAEAEEVSVLDYWKVLKRRRYLFAVPAIGIALLTIVYALSLPAIYRSEATILIEDEEIPEDIVGATITNYASQQIQLISRRILTMSNIRSIIDKYDVYGSNERGETVSPNKLTRWFRQDMQLNLVSEEIIDRHGREAEAAVAFTVAFYSGDPSVAQNVTEELVTFFLNENMRSSASKAIGVSELLIASIDKANEELLEAEAQLAEFKAENEGALPELYQLNINVINRNEQQLSDINLRLQELQQRKLQLSSELASLSPSAPVTLPSGETIMSDRERLRALLVDYRRKSAIYEAGHPDLVRIEREIETLRRTVGDPQIYQLNQEQLREERERLALLRDRYSDDHPDIKHAEAAIAKLETQLANTSPSAVAQTGVADNPAYILIDTQLKSTNLEIQSLLKKRGDLQRNIADHEALIKQAPHVEMQYEALLRRMQNARTKYNDLQAKLRAAEVATDVQEEMSGQRFTLIEPPRFPYEPVDQKRSAIITMGLFLAVGVGVGLVVIAEFMDDSIRSVRELTKIAGSPPLTVIPYLNNSVDVAHAQSRRHYMIVAFLAGTALAVAYIVLVS